MLAYISLSIVHYYLHTQYIDYLVFLSLTLYCYYGIGAIALT